MSKNLFQIGFIIFGFIIFMASVDASLFGESSPVTLTVLTPYDPTLSDGLQTIARDYGKDHNTIINVVSVKGRKKIVDEITGGNTSADLVVIEKEYPVFNLNGLKTLEKEGLIDKSEEIYRSEADLIVSPVSTITSVKELNGTKFAAVDLVHYHMPGGCLANSVMDYSPMQVTVLNQSGIDTIYQAVVNGSADATILWKTDYLNQKKNGGELKAIPVPEYGMDNYIATIKGSKNPSEAESFMNYVVAHKNEFSN